MQFFGKQNAVRNDKFIRRSGMLLGQLENDGKVHYGKTNYFWDGDKIVSKEEDELSD